MAITIVAFITPVINPALGITPHPLVPDDTRAILPAAMRDVSCKPVAGAPARGAAGGSAINSE